MPERLKTITIFPYQPQWPEEFCRLGRELRQQLGPLALRIDHIGSTSVPDLAAKDIIDIQVTVSALAPEVEQLLLGMGCLRKQHISQDHLPPGETDAGRWQKWIFQPPVAWRPAHIHVRISGLPNQRYPLLFRDYLRAHPVAAQAYAQVKTALASLHPQDVDAYYAVKDPVCDIIIAGAESWAAASGWQPGPMDI